MTVIEHARTYWKAVLLATALCIASGQLLPLWASLPINVAMGWTLGHWPHGVRLGPLEMFESMDGFKPLGIYVVGWRSIGEHEPGTLRWSLEWIAPAGWSLFKPRWTDSTGVYGMQHAPFRSRLRRLELPLLGVFTLSSGRDLLAAIEV